MSSFAHLDLLASLQSPGQVGLSAPPFEFSDMGFSLLLRAFAHLELTALISGLFRLGLAFVLPVVDVSSFEPSFFLQSPSQVGFVVSPLDLAACDPTPFVRSFAYPGSAPSVSDFLRLGFFSSARSPMHVELFLLVLSTARPESFPPVADSAHAGFCALLQSLARVGPASSTLNFATMGLSMFVRSSVQCGFNLSVMGIVHTDSLFILSVMGAVELGLASSAHSFSRLGLAMFLFDSAQIDPSASTRNPARAEPSVLAFGLSRPGFVFVLSVVDRTCLDPSVSVHSPSQIDFPMPTSDHAHVGLAVPSRGLCCVELLVFVLATCSVGFFPPVMDFAFVDSSMLLRSLTRLDLAMFPFDAQSISLSMFLQSSARLEPSVLLPGLSRAGPVFVLSVIDMALLGFSLLVRSCVCLGSGPSMVDASALGSLTFLKSFTCLGFVVLVVGLSRVGFVSLLSVIDKVHFDPSSLIQSFGHLDSLVLVVDFAMVGSPALIRSPACPDSALPMLDFSKMESAMSLRSSLRVGLLVLPTGSSWVGSVSSLLVIDDSHLGFIIFCRSAERGVDSSDVVVRVMCQLFVSRVEINSKRMQKR